ncbi:GT2 family glycosyltransferase [Primorskyibacter sedentarius]|uniref:GT2 family glycosyltransferase n=1 Tax=Primorskyibacter sedentarius TaxID=745311 RepID=A0A4R3J4W4_9RHOB|nr:glycosyltransferase family 2 protein [Primorskyibacter sedentarius]TCS59836.1 GT2 family glycosyltransferase [Primorskyibacter sedentarius]
MTNPGTATGPAPRVLTIVLNYKTADMTLDSVAAARIAMEGIPGGIIIVDNDSQDGSFERISAHVAREGWDAEGRVRVVQAGHNGGFGAGNNVGIRAGLADGSAPDYVYVLNSDAFPAPDAIRVLLNHLEATPEAGFAGSYIHGPEGDTHLTSFRFPSIASEFEGSIRFGPVSRLLKNHRVPVETPTQTQAVDWLAGASIMMRQSVLDEIGLFDETFFLYFEETDLCLRAARAGHRTDYLPASKVAHIGSATTGMKEWKRMPSYWYDSRWYYFSKNYGRLYATAATAMHLLGGGLDYLRCLVTRRERKVTPGFLTTMLFHDMRALVRRPAASQVQESRDTISQS